MKFGIQLTNANCERFFFKDFCVINRKYLICLIFTILEIFSIDLVFWVFLKNAFYKYVKSKNDLDSENFIQQSTQPISILT